MYLRKETNASYNFKAPNVAADADKVIEVLFPASETQDIDEAASVEIEIKQMHTFVNIEDLAHDCEVSVSADSEVSKGAELLLKIAAIDAPRTITYGTGISGNSFVVPAGESRYIFAKYNGTDFVVVSADVAVVDDDSITTDKIVDKAVTTDKIADKAVDTGQIADKAVTGAQIDDKAVDTGQIADKAVTGSQIDDKAVDTGQIADKAVGTGQIGDKAVDTGQIADDAVTGTQIDDLAVDTQHIVDKAVETAKIDDLAVTAGQLASDAVETLKIKDGNVTLAKLAAATKGDILYYNAGWQVLPIGTSGQVLKVSSGGVPEWTT